MRPGPEWFIAIETLGIISFAVNALIVAKGKGLSALGLFLCAALTALGGGTVRDLLLGPQALPFFWAAFPFYIVAIFALSMAYAHLPPLRDLIGKRDVLIKETAEAVALASLGTLGAAKTFAILGPGDGSALASAYVLILCASLGAMSAAFGGILRDVVINEFPGVLRPGMWLLEALFIGCLLLALLRLAGVPGPWALLWGFLTVLGIRAWVVIGKERRRRAPATT